MGQANYEALEVPVEDPLSEDPVVEDPVPVAVALVSMLEEEDPVELLLESLLESSLEDELSLESLVWYLDISKSYGSPLGISFVTISALLL